MTNVIHRQHVWVGPEATTFEAPCEACQSKRDRDPWSVAFDGAEVQGTLRRDADVGFTTCRSGHRIIVRRMKLTAVPSGHFH